jgi:hypothetical protein
MQQSRRGGQVLTSDLAHPESQCYTNGVNADWYYP